MDAQPARVRDGAEAAGEKVAANGRGRLSGCAQIGRLALEVGEPLPAPRGAAM
jgi:hypothetical protein